ncbi:SDR family NAD(P)-dependent oxidoreductase [Paractinoplanes maris]|uniref:SDR family NAD(P)-dependent oxidoreductase n=1 Tax=Paractinoplanes maris TaxID=1734446 RepID=UPI00201FCE3A|nr:SDR family NAD(P)-dependent oxidoreductase [Actinoplanes maris]
MGDTRGATSGPRVAVVTEATTALGRAISLALARAGYAVLGSGRTPRVGELVMRRIRDQGGDAVFLSTDPDCEDATAAFVAEAAARHGRLDVAVNNAGAALDEGRLADVRTEAVEQMFRLNVLTVFWAMKYQIRQMLAQDPAGGVILNLATAAGVDGVRFSAGYSATRHAVVGLTRSAALEYAVDGIRVLGFVPASTQHAPLAGAPAAWARNNPQITGFRPADRREWLDGTAAAIVRLAAPEAAFITETVVRVDGGHGPATPPPSP